MCSLEKSVLGKNCFFLLCFPARITTMQLTHNPLYEAVLGNNMRLCWCFLSDAVCGLVLASSACFSYRCLNMERICGVKAVTPLFVPSSSNDRCLPVRLVCFCLSAHAYHRHFMLCILKVSHRRNC